MAKITIKRTTSNNLPNTLEFGELAYVQGLNKLVVGNDNNTVSIINESSNKRNVFRNTITANFNLTFDYNYYYITPNTDNLIVNLPTNVSVGNFLIIRNISNSNRLIVSFNNINLFSLGLGTNGYEADLTYDGVEWQVTIY